MDGLNFKEERAYYYLNKALEEYRIARREKMLWRDPKPYLSIASEYERLAIAIVGEERVQKYIESYRKG